MFSSAADAVLLNIYDQAPTCIRTKRLTEMFSPMVPISSFSLSWMVRSGFLMNFCSSRQASA